jgi:hypothetical protein
MKMCRSLSVALVLLAGCHSTTKNDAGPKWDGSVGGSGAGGSSVVPGADATVGDAPVDLGTRADGPSTSQPDAGEFDGTGGASGAGGGGGQVIPAGGAGGATHISGTGGGGGVPSGGAGAGGVSANGGRTGGGLDAGPSNTVDGAASPDVPIVPPSARKLDLVFVIDNSPSMAPKIAKLQAQFPKLIESLEDPALGIGLPDLRVALIDSDLGTMNAYSGACGPNDSNGNSLLGDQGKFQMRDAAKCGVTDSKALWLEYGQGAGINFTGSIGSVFACLAGNLGTMGCGIEHPLQAVEFALVADGLGNEAQRTLLRPDASLGLVFLTDEDDCSAAMNDAMFGDQDSVRGEAASLRCSTRGHTCGGINLNDGPGAPGCPTTTAFEAPLASCAARTDACPNPIDPGVQGIDTRGPTMCSPLRDYVRMANELKALKADPTNQILVAGIFGWPLGGDMQKAEPYRIAKTPNPNTYDSSHPQIFDVWPICYDPTHPPTNPDSTTGFDATAAGWGATPGVRLGAFIDQFGSNGIKFSICETDFGEAVKQIGRRLAQNPYGATGGGTGGPRPKVDFDALPSDARTNQPDAAPEVGHTRCDDGGSCKSTMVIPALEHRAW